MNIQKPIDSRKHHDYLQNVLVKLLNIYSPTGFTDEIVHFVCQELTAIGVPHEITRRGGIRGTLTGRKNEVARAVVSHLDTVGAMVKSLKPNGRLEVVPVGHWNSRFAEGGRVTLFTDSGRHRGTVLPLKASGHAYDKEIDTQPSDWKHVEVRVDARCNDRQTLQDLGFHVGDYVAFDAHPEIDRSGYINARHLDNKAGVAIMLTLAKTMMEAGLSQLPVDLYLLFTISEEVGSGASSILHGDIAEMVTIDNGVVAPGQNSSEYGATIAMADASGPYDYHLTHRLIDICNENDIMMKRDLFTHYKSDSASAVEAGNDIRTALVCFGIDASHGHERTHLDSIVSLLALLSAYVRSPFMFERDTQRLGPIKDFPTL